MVRQLNPSVVRLGNLIQSGCALRVAAQRILISVQSMRSDHPALHLSPTAVHCYFTCRKYSWLNVCCGLQLTDDILVGMELFPPLKAQALEYLDKGGKKPDR